MHPADDIVLYHAVGDVLPPAGDIILYHAVGDVLPTAGYGNVLKHDLWNFHRNTLSYAFRNASRGSISTMTSSSLPI